MVWSFPFLLCKHTSQENAVAEYEKDDVEKNKDMLEAVDELEEYLCLENNKYRTGCAYIRKVYRQNMGEKRLAGIIDGNVRGIEYFLF